MTTTHLEPQVYEALEQIVDPCSAASASPMNLVEMGLVKDVVLSEGGSRVDVHLRLTSPQCLMIGYMTKAARRLIGALPGVERVEVHADEGLDWTPSMIHDGARSRRRLQLQVLADRAASSHGRVTSAG